MKYDANRYGHGDLERYSKAFTRYLKDSPETIPATLEELARVEIDHLPTQENGVRLGVRVQGDHWLYSTEGEILDILNMRDYHESL